MRSAPFRCARGCPCPPAGGTTGTKIVADATPDGHTLLSVSSSHSISPSIYAKLPYDTRRDFAGITTTATANYMLVVPTSLPVKNVSDLIALAKAKPGQLNFGSAGNERDALCSRASEKYGAAFG